MKEDVQRLMARAYNALADARLIYETGRYNSVPNRSYYAIFDAVNALLRLHDSYAKTHKGLKSQFNERYVRTDKMPHEANLWLEASFELRQSGDYDFEYDVTESDAAKSIEYATNFLLQAEAFLRSEIGIE
ncbi:MAG: HEPN domain-containing protein [Cytophagales bacterium]|nr:MAG: HEPN domain-containing protein [Cytophagales bacterium]